MSREELEKLTATKLREIAKEYDDITGASAMKKEDLSHYGHQHIRIVNGRYHKDTALCCMPLSRRSGRFPALPYPPR